METKAKKSGTHYISAKESRRISRQNRKIMRAFEKKKRRKNVPESEYLTQMKDPANIVEFDDLHTCFYTDVGTVKAVDGVTFSIPKESIVGVVGESGCGKSVTSLSLMQLVQGPRVRSAAAPSVFVPATVRCMTLPKCRRKT
ncbi:oligopeptide/dipeptide ABC transporter ATPase subunit [Clostridium sp. CAG:448]|nr:oligopeptide/dipeptide ABC transporter ATPase subunit [Clostridium sp. CAG:448]